MRTSLSRPSARSLVPRLVPLLTALVFSCVVLVAAPGALSGAVGAPEESEEPPVLTGTVSREQVEEAVPAWVGSVVEAQVDEAAAAALASVDPGASVTIYFGTWCSDSAREVPRFWRALDQVGGLVPFEIEHIAVDRADKRPPELAETVNLLYVPTFIVRRGGREIGRVVETSPNGIEADLLALLTGEASGVLSTREDL